MFSFLYVLIFNRVSSPGICKKYTRVCHTILKMACQGHTVPTPPPLSRGSRIFSFEFTKFEYDTNTSRQQATITYSTQVTQKVVFSTTENFFT